MAQSIDGSIVQRESVRRSENTILAQELLVAGDSAYKGGDYKKASESYSQAFQLLPKGALTAELKEAAAERYAQAVVEYTKTLARFGQYDQARVLLEAVLEDGVAPHHAGAKQALAKLDDPIRNNPSLTPQLARDAEAAGKWLRRAEGYYELGKFNDSLLAYEEVLHLDPTNKAARRGMERVSNAISDYAGAARDHARAHALAQVDEAWQIKENVTDPRFQSQVILVEEDTRIQEVYANKMKQIVVPTVDLQDMDLSECIDMLRLWSKQYDQYSLNEADKGINFVVNIGNRDSDWAKIINAKRVNLNLRSVPLDKVADYIASATGTQWRYTQHAVMFTPAGSADTEIYRRTFRVPPTFLLDAASSAANDNDPFAEPSGNNNALAAKVSAQDYLKSLGVSFPEGASAKYIKGTGALIVANTRPNLDIIEEYIRTLAKTESVQVVMKVKVLDVSQSDLEELGFDWLVGSVGGSDRTIFGGGSQGNGFDVISDGQTSAPGLNPVTSGLRSGDTSFAPRVLDGAITNSSDAAFSSLERAPGILTLTNEDFQVVMRGLNQKTGTDQLNEVSVVARSGERATVFAGRELRVPTEYEPPELPNTVGASTGGVFPVTPSHPTAFEEEQTGNDLSIEATVAENKQEVDVSIDFTIRDFEGFVNYGSPITTAGTNPLTGAVTTVPITANEILMPIFKSIPINTALTIQDGHTIAIGGLKQVAIEKVEDKVPVLGDVPMVGRFFSSEGVRKAERVIVIFVTVDLKDPTGKNWRDR